MLFIKYLFIGVLNTIVGFGVIFLLMLAGHSAEFSNICGYIIGIFFSYVMNKICTFQTKNRGFQEAVKFLCAMLMAYSLNFMTLKFCLYSQINPYVSQVIAGGIYTISGFGISKSWVFKK